MPLLEPELSETDRLAEIKKQAEFLVQNDVHFIDVIDRVIKNQAGTDKLLLVIDQWEELYTLTTEMAIPQPEGKELRFDARTVTKRFIEEILQAIASPHLKVVLTLRADFYGEALEDRDLSDTLQDAVVNLSPMNEDEILSIITSPAESVGLRIQKGLAGTHCERRQ